MPNGPPFLENFDDPKLPNWTLSGTHSVSGGKLVLGSATNNRDNVYAYVKVPGKQAKDATFTPYTNFTTEARARLVSDPKNWGGFGIWFRTNGAGQFRNGDWNPDGGGGYVFDYTPGRGGVALLRRSHSMMFAGPPHPETIDHNWHMLRVDAVGPHITAYFDGQKVFDGVSPEKPFGYTNGAVGLGAYNRGQVEVDSFRITPH